MNRGLIIIGASGHGKVVADIAKNMKVYSSIFFLDDDLKKKVGGYELLGSVDEYRKWKETHDFIVAIGDCEIRSRIQKLIEKDVKIATLIHPRAVVGEDVVIGQGTVIMANVAINTGAVLGEGVIVNTGSTIDHDCYVGDYVHVAPGCHICGAVTVGDGSWLGVGSCVINNIELCKNCYIGAGAAVVDNIWEKGVYVGVPAKKMNCGDMDA